MSKSDRIPDAWPLLMSDEMAARFCDLSLSQFRALVTAGKLPAGKAVFGTACTRWLRKDLETRILTEFGGAGSAPGDDPASKQARRQQVDREFGIG
jgi:hypothetical protein